MPEFKADADVSDRPELDRKEWGESRVVLHEGRSEGTWVMADENDFVAVEP